MAKVGRADTSTDPSPTNMTETIVHLKPRDQWRVGMTLERLRAELPLPSIELPFLFTPDIGREQVGVLADALSRGIERL